MLITFQSKATAEITMYKEHIVNVLKLLGKNADQGVITAQETVKAIAIIEALIVENNLKEKLEQEKINSFKLGDSEEESDTDELFFEKQKVSLPVRLFPFFEMLKEARKKQCDILWGV